MQLIIKSVKQTKLGQWFKKTRFWKFLKQSQGDWRYPFMVLAWSVSRWIVPRKRINVDGVSFTLPCTNWITHFRWYLFKKKEAEVRRYIDNYIQEGDNFFDVGANIGVFSIYAAKRFANISCYCFEPEYSNLNVLKDNIVANDITNKVTIHSVAISNAVGLSKLNLQDLTTGAAAHTESKEPIDMTHEGYPVVWAEGIATVSLDYISKELNVFPNALKIDTDGNEDKVLEGAALLLRDSRLRSLVIEMPDENEKGQYCSRLLSEANFRLDWSDMENTRNQVWVRKDNGEEKK